MATFVILAVTAEAVNFADTAGVTELAGALAADINDTISLVYANSTWVELGRSVN